MRAEVLRRALRDSVAPVARKLRRLASRTLLRRVSYAGKMRLLQIQGEGGQALNDIEHLEPFGFTSHPLPGAEAVTLAFNGNGSHTVAILVNDQRYRLVVAEGEAAIYNHHGDRVHIKQDRTISVEAAVKVVIDAPDTECTGNLKVLKNLAVVGDSLLTGPVTASAAIAASGPVSAPSIATDAGIKLGTHTHDESDGGTTEGPNL